MKLTNEQIDKILSDAPGGADEFFIYQGAANYIDNHENGHQFKIWCEDENKWVFSELVDGWQYIRGRRSLLDLREILELRKESESKTQRIMQFDAAMSEIGAHIQKSEPGFTMCGVDTGDSQAKIIGYIKQIEEVKEAAKSLLDAIDYGEFKCQLIAADKLKELIKMRKFAKSIDHSNGDV